MSATTGCFSDTQLTCWAKSITNRIHLGREWEPPPACRTSRRLASERACREAFWTRPATKNKLLLSHRSVIAYVLMEKSYNLLWLRISFTFSSGGMVLLSRTVCTLARNWRDKDTQNKDSKTALSLEVLFFPHSHNNSDTVLGLAHLNHNLTNTKWHCISVQ